MKKINSQMLESLNKALGLSGRGSQATELTDGIVDQVIDVLPVVRRSRTFAQTDGIFYALLRNVHAAADSRAVSLFPYAPTTTALPPYPAPMPRDFDVWLLSSAIRQSAGAGTLSGSLRISAPAELMGLSTLGTPIGSTTNVAFWDTLVTEGVTFGILAAEPKPVQKIGLRLPRATTTELIFASTSSAATTFDCICMLGVFPVGLGQDVLV